MAAPDPIRLFQSWFRKAQKARLAIPEAMTLATVDARGRPDARTVLLKGIHEGRFTFFTNYQSRKSRELGAKPYAALVFHWAPLELQVRIEGSVKRTTREESEAYFATRPLVSQIGAWASHQSETIPSRATLLAQFKAIEKRFRGRQVPCPPHWGGFHLLPSRIEFWHGRTGRLHDRILYERTARGWKTSRLSP